MKYITVITGKNIENFPKRRECFLTKHTLINMKQLRMSQESTGKISTSPGGTETISRNTCLYQVPAMVGTNASTKINHKFYNSMVQAISRRGVDCTTKCGSLCDLFVDKVFPVKKPGGKWTH